VVIDISTSAPRYDGGESTHVCMMKDVSSGLLRMEEVARLLFVTFIVGNREFGIANTLQQNVLFIHP
jgi:hypothetical protein